MKSMNKIQLIGWLGNDPVFRTASNGTPYVYIRLATDVFIPRKDQPVIKITDWHNIRIWGEKKVERLRNYLCKGSHVMVEGRITQRNFTDASGQKRYVTEIKASLLVDLDR
jgi:single-strand DNA-binding protein